LRERKALVLDGEESTTEIESGVRQGRVLIVDENYLAALVADDAVGGGSVSMTRRPGAGGIRGSLAEGVEERDKFGRVR
jgi:hypothetical protein